MPLLAQPIVEYCLGIPSWCWCMGGQNRAIARRAFAARLPPEITGRRTKGGADSLGVEIVDRDRLIIRDALLGGQLAEAGLLDHAALEPALSTAVVAASDYRRILQLADAEAWARSWMGKTTIMTADRSGAS